MTTLIGNRYRLYEKLGVGGMGTVFRAEDRLTGDMLALKRVPLPSLMSDDNPDADHMRLALSREFRMLASLRHPNIISVIDYGFDSEREPFFTMDWLQNAQSITLAGSNAPPEERARLLADTLRALAYLHRRGVIHRDLKPANVLVERHGRVKVLDFGLALDRSSPVLEEQIDGGMTGTLAYLAPELLTDSPPSVSSDLYALGVMAYELFAGKYPYSMKNAALLIREIFGATPDFTPLPARLLPIIARLLLKTPHERYQSADEVVSDLARAFDQPFGQDSIEIRESYIRASTFVGREEELAQLGKALDAAFAGHGSAWLVGGESGVGKSRLLDELRIRALVKGALVARGRVSEQGRVPYELWRDALRRLTISTEFSDLEAGVLRALIPDIETLIGRTVPPAPPLDGAASLQRLKLTITDVLARQKTPLVMLLEDLQWGAESVDILSHVVQSAEQHKWLIIGTYRDDEAPALPDELPHTRVIKLARLSDSEIAALSAAMLGAVGRQSFVLDLLKKESEGNTFFITEVVRVILDESGGMSEVGRVTLPTSVVAGGIQQVIRRRLERVPEWARPALARAAVAGREIDLKLLPAFGVTDPETWLAACVNAAVIDVVDGEWNFAHDKLRQSVLRGIDADELARLNREIAEALERTYPDNAAYAETLAEHWRAAGENEKAFAYALKAGEYLIGLTAEYERAERLLLQALNLDAGRAHVRNLLGEASLRRGLHDSAIGHYQVVLDDRHADSFQRTRAYNGLSEIARIRGNWDESVHYAQAAHEIAENSGDRAGVAVKLNSLGSVLAVKREFQAALEHYEQALAIQRERGDAVAMVAVLGNLGIALYGLGKYREAITTQEESLALYQATGQRRGIALTYNRLATNYARLGEGERARGYYEQSLAIMRTIGDPMGVFDSLNNLGMISYGRGEYENAYARFKEALQVARSLSNPNATARALNNVGATLKEQGRYDQARQYVEEAIAINRAGGDDGELAYALNSLGDLHYVLDALDEARTAYEESLALTDKIGDRVLRPFNLASLGVVYARGGDFTRAGKVLADGLTVAHETASKPRIAHLLLNTAIMCALRRDDARAAELCGVIDALHALESEYDIAYAQLQDDARRYPDFKAAAERGKAADLEAVIAGLIAALG